MVICPALFCYCIFDLVFVAICSFVLFFLAEFSGTFLLKYLASSRESFIQQGKQTELFDPSWLSLLPTLSSLYFIHLSINCSPCVLWNRSFVVLRALVLLYRPSSIFSMNFRLFMPSLLSSHYHRLISLESLCLVRPPLYPRLPLVLACSTLVDFNCWPRSRFFLLRCVAIVARSTARDYVSSFGIFLDDHYLTTKIAHYMAKAVSRV
jgi:hypothetical protein